MCPIRRERDCAPPRIEPDVSDQEIIEAMAGACGPAMWKPSLPH